MLLIKYPLNTFLIKQKRKKLPKIPNKQSNHKNTLQKRKKKPQKNPTPANLPNTPNNKQKQKPHQQQKKNNTCSILHPVVFL